MNQRPDPLVFTVYSPIAYATYLELKKKPVSLNVFDEAVEMINQVLILSTYIFDILCDIV